jgi:hypothetical protein
LDEFADLVLQATQKMPAGYWRSFGKLRMTRNETATGQRRALRDYTSI